MTIHFFLPAVITLAAGLVTAVAGYITVASSFGSLKRLNWMPIGIYMTWAGVIAMAGAVFIQVSHWL